MSGEKDRDMCMKEGEPNYFQAIKMTLDFTLSETGNQWRLQRGIISLPQASLLLTGRGGNDEGKNIVRMIYLQSS